MLHLYLNCYGHPFHRGPWTSSHADTRTDMDS